MTKSSSSLNSLNEHHFNTYIWYYVHGKYFHIANFHLLEDPHNINDNISGIKVLYKTDYMHIVFLSTSV